MGGFTTSTLLTLVVVPVLFTYVDNFQRWMMNVLKHGFGRKNHLAGMEGNSTNGFYPNDETQSQSPIRK
jgi:hypothetical protein